MGSAETFKSAQDIHASLRESGERVGLTTVYRHLQLLADAGTIDALSIASGETVYRLCRSGDHHHHIVCRVCARSVEVEAPDVERWTEAIASSLGYSDVSHTLDVFGVCRACAKS